MCFGISMSSDFMCKSVIPAPISFAATTSQASSYMVWDSSQAYTARAPALFANMLQGRALHQEKTVRRIFSHDSGIVILKPGVFLSFFNTTIICSILKNELIFLSR